MYVPPWDKFNALDLSTLHGSGFTTALAISIEAGESPLCIDQWLDFAMLWMFGALAMLLASCLAVFSPCRHGDNAQPYCQQDEDPLSCY